MEWREIPRKRGLPIGQQVRQFAEDECETDFLVLGVEKRGSAGIIGSVSDAIVKSAKCHCLVVKDRP